MAEIDVRNERSYKLCERLGMRREAELKQVYPSKEGGYNDFYIYAILREEYND
jgi:aminoglycoside 6'-N-acetyltransferase